MRHLRSMTASIGLLAGFASEVSAGSAGLLAQATKPSVGPQYAVAIVCTLLVLFIVCAPSRKEHTG